MSFSVVKKEVEDRDDHHDSEIIGWLWNKLKGEFAIEIDDIESYCFDLPEYSGPTPGKMVFTGVNKIDVCYLSIVKEREFLLNVELRADGPDFNRAVFNTASGKIEILFRDVQFEYMK